MWREKYYSNPRINVNSSLIAEWAVVDDVDKLLQFDNINDFIKSLHSTQSIDAIKKIFLCEFSDISSNVNDDHLEQFWKAFEDILDDEEITRVLLNEHIHGTPLNNIDEISPTMSRGLLNLYKKHLSHGEILTLLKRVSSSFISPLNSALEAASDYQVDILWRFINELRLKRTEIRDLLGKVGCEKSRFSLIYSVTSLHKFKMIAGLYEKYFTKEEIAELIVDHKGYEKWNFLHSYVEHAKEDVGMFEYLTESVQLTNEELRKLLVTRNSVGQTPFSYANGKERKFLLEPFEALLTPSELSEAYTDQILIAREDQHFSCHFKIFMPEGFEDWEDILEELEIPKIIQKLLQKDFENVVDIFHAVVFPQVQKLTKTWTPEKWERLYKMLEVLGFNRNTTNKEAFDVLLGISNMNINNAKSSLFNDILLIKKSSKFEGLLPAIRKELLTKSSIVWSDVFSGFKETSEFKWIGFEFVNKMQKGMGYVVKKFKP